MENHSAHPKQAVPALPWHTPDTEEYKKRRPAYCANNPAVPRAILCPRNAEEVAAIVRLSRENDIPISVRSGGHDLYGRSIVHDSLCIDMRDINFVEVAHDRKTAVLGGGVQLGKLSQKLHDKGLVTPSGSVPDIGYVGWATLGGYGCLSTSFGLGVDQIVGAEVVNDKGQIVTADEQMLQGIRGGGGNFGIITSIRVKVYEVKTYLAGLLMFDTSTAGISRTFKDVILKVQELEEQREISNRAVLQPLIVNHPEAGRTFAITFVWSSDDHDEGRKQLEKLVEELPATVFANTVSPIAAPDWIRMIGGFIAEKVWGGPYSVSFGTLSAETMDIIGKHLEEMPSDPGTCFSLHSVSSQSPSVANTALADASCFNPEARQRHTMIEIVGSSVSEDSMDRCVQWAKSLRDELLAGGKTMQGSYVSITGPNILTLGEMYGEKVGLLRALKQKYDPDGVFKYAVPRMME